MFLKKPIWPTRTQNCFMENTCFVHNDIETLWCYQLTLLNMNSLDFFNEVALFRQFTVLYGIKEHKNAFWR